MKKSRRLNFWRFVSVFIFVLAGVSESHALSLSPSIYEGTRSVSVSDIAREIGKASKQDSEITIFLLARLYQEAYARKASALPVETWSGTDYYPWAYEDPGLQEIRPAADAKQEQQAKRDLEKATRYFSDFVRLPPPKMVIGGTQGAFEGRKLRAYRGLIWCFKQQGKDDEIRKVYPEYMALAAKSDESEALSAWLMVQPYAGSSSELKPQFSQIKQLQATDLVQKWDQIAKQQKTPYSIWRAKANLHKALYGTGSEEVYVRETGGTQRYYLEQVIPASAGQAKNPQHRKQAIELYEKVLAVPDTEQAQGSYPELVGRDRLKDKLNLLQLKS